MSRGGRGGGGASRLNGIPFDIDPKLEEEMNAFREGEREDDDDWLKTLYPSMHVDLPPPPTEKEKREVNAWRQHRAAIRKGPFFIDDTPTTGKRDLATFNAFEDAATYSNSNKRNKRAGGLPSLKRLPIVKEFLPKELWGVLGDDEEGGDNVEAPKKNLDFLKKKRFDKLAQFDEGADVDGAALDDDDDQDKQDEDGGDGVEIPEDDDFSEDDDDLGNDYNAEKYFDDGDGVDDDGDDAGGDEAWQTERVDAEISQFERIGWNKTTTDMKWREANKVRGLGKSGGGYDITCEKARAAAAGEELWRRMREIDHPRKEGSRRVGLYLRERDLLPAYYENRAPDDFKAPEGPRL